MAANDLNLDGSETTILKILLSSSSEISGEVIMEKCDDMLPTELIDVLKGLMDLGYVDADKSGFYSADELKDVNFMVNSGYSTEIRKALRPQKEPAGKSKRVRRE